MTATNERLVLADVPADVARRLSEDAAREGIALRSRGSRDASIEEWIEGSDATAVIVSEPDVLAGLDERVRRFGGRLVVMTDAVPLRREARRRGIAVVGRDANWSDVVAALGESVRTGRTHGAAHGRLTVVWGPTGAPGRSSVAAALAAELAAAGRTVVLVDADTYGAAQSAAHGIVDDASGIAAACRAAARKELTIDSLERHLQRYRSADTDGFWILTGISRAARWPELSEEHLIRVLTVCRDWADEVVVDAGFNIEQDEEISSDILAPRRNTATLVPLRMANVVVAVSGAEPVGVMRFVRAFADVAECCAAARIVSVVNRVRWNALGASPANQLSSAFESLLAVDDPLVVPFDQRVADRAFAEQATWREVAPRSALVHAIRRIAITIDPTLGRESRGQRRAKHPASTSLLHAPRLGARRWHRTP